MNRRQHIRQLEDELRARGAEFMVDDGFDEEMTESFLERVLLCETAERKALREWLAEGSYVPPAPPNLRSLIDHLALLGIAVENSDHLGDDELYAFLDSHLDEPIALLPGTIMHLDVIGSGSDEDNAAWLTFYANDEDRARWKEEFPDEELPPKKDPSFRRNLPEAFRGERDAS